MNREEMLKFFAACLREYADPHPTGPTADMGADEMAEWMVAKMGAHRDGEPIPNP